MSNNKSAKFKPKSDHEYYKSFGGYQNFMHSYGLKTYNEDDVEQGKAIIEGFREQDRYEWEQSQKQQGK